MEASVAVNAGLIGRQTWLRKWGGGDRRGKFMHVSESECCARRGTPTLLHTRQDNTAAPVRRSRRDAGRVAKRRWQDEFCALLLCVNSVVDKPKTFVIRVMARPTNQEQGHGRTMTRVDVRALATIVRRRDFCTSSAADAAAIARIQSCSSPCVSACSTNTRLMVGDATSKHSVRVYLSSGTSVTCSDSSGMKPRSLSSWQNTCTSE